MIKHYQQYLSLLEGKKVLILGDGFLADRFREWSKLRDTPFFFAEPFTIKGIRVDYVINLVADTKVRNGSAKNQSQFNINFPLEFSKNCGIMGVKFCHVSTADIYASGTSINENAPIACDTPYYCSKYLGEQTVLEANENALIVRPRLLFDERNNKKNLINKLESYSSVYNLNQSITSTDCLIAAILYLLDKDCSGVFNIAESGFVNFADYYIDKKKLNEGVKSIILNCNKLKETGFKPGIAMGSFSSCLSNWEKEVI